MLAVRVPPSAWMTSQSSVIVRSPSRLMSTTPRRLRPIRRWISCVRPVPTVGRLRAGCAGFELRGSMLYSAVIQPRPFPRIQPGTRSSMVAAQITRVSPTRIRTEPSANLR